jgi:cell division protein FtsQ
MPLFVLGIRIMAGIGMVGMMGLFFVFAHDFFTQSDYFITKNIHVKGERRLLPKEIIEHAQIATGRNLLSFNLSLLRKRLLTHPWIAEAEVSRELPAGITITIKEHAPLAVIDLGRHFLMDVHGQIFKEWEPSDLDRGADNLPVINGLAYSDLNSSGTPGTLPFKAVMEVLHMQGEAGDIFPGMTIKKIHVDREIGLTLSVSDRVKRIKLGYGDFCSKYERLKKVLAYTDKNKGFPDMDFIDLNCSNCIVVKPVNIKSPTGEQKEA